MILGLVRLMQPVHGYDVRRELLSWRADEWANVAPGSIYHALRKLSDEEMLTEVATEQVGSRPARTTYSITDKGVREFEELLHSYWWEYKQPVDPFLAGFAFLAALPRREAAAALRNRARMLRVAADGLRASLDSEWARRDKPTYVSWMFELTIDRLTVEAAWCERIAGRVETGEPYFPGDMTRLVSDPAGTVSEQLAVE
jgi:DNA-binding PadR family transcriptional regulator